MTGPARQASFEWWRIVEHKWYVHQELELTAARLLPSTDHAPTSSSLAKLAGWRQGQYSSLRPLWSIPSPTQLKSCHAKEGKGGGTLSLSAGGWGWLLGSDYRMCVCKNPLPSFLHTQHFWKAVHSLINLKLPDICVAKYLSVPEQKYCQCFSDPASALIRNVLANLSRIRL